ncbi:unnamed protein product [Linum tenue]|uniref:Large ribosomal subunit protein bL34m n=1 Tax=Linum tenue TaxID=586396 RepID=A0AAV0KBV1_9ROSI|nr:unnamed protein product [Linum tenue]
MSSSKTLVQNGASLINRLFRSHPTLHQQIPIMPKHHQLLQSPPHALRITPQLFPSLHNFQPSEHSPEIDDFNSIQRLTSEGFLNPCGLPSLEFFLPEGDSSDEMLLFPKRTFQPSTLRRKRNHGFFARKATKGGRKVIARRVAKGRFRITA